MCVCVCMCVLVRWVPLSRSSGNATPAGRGSEWGPWEKPLPQSPRTVHETPGVQPVPGVEAQGGSPLIELRLPRVGLNLQETGLETWSQGQRAPGTGSPAGGAAGITTAWGWDLAGLGRPRGLLLLCVAGCPCLVWKHKLFAVKCRTPLLGTAGCVGSYSDS